MITKLTPTASAFYALKIIAIAFAATSFLCTSALAFQLGLEWDPNVEQDLAGYIVYYGTSSRNYEYSVDIGNETSSTISGLETGKTYYFAVTAYDIEDNESNFSREVCYPKFRCSTVPAVALILLLQP
jgi:fibronectin type 3 domain-containing protein